MLYDKSTLCDRTNPCARTILYARTIKFVRISARTRLSVMLNNGDARMHMLLSRRRRIIIPSLSSSIRHLYLQTTNNLHIKLWNIHTRLQDMNTAAMLHPECRFLAKWLRRQHLWPAVVELCAVATIYPICTVITSGHVQVVHLLLRYLAMLDHLLCRILLLIMHTHLTCILPSLIRRINSRRHRLLTRLTTSISSIRQAHILPCLRARQFILVLVLILIICITIVRCNLILDMRRISNRTCRLRSRDRQKFMLNILII